MTADPKTSAETTEATPVYFGADFSSGPDRTAEVEYAIDAAGSVTVLSVRTHALTIEGEAVDVT